MVKLPRTLGLALGLAALAMVLTGLGTAYAQVVPQVPLPGNKIPQFVDPLPLLDLQGGPMETVVLPGAAETTLTMQEFKANVMPTGFVPANGLPYAGTTVWGYRNTTGQADPAPLPVGVQGTYLGPVFVTARDVPTQIKFVNNLGFVDPTGTKAGRSQLAFWTVSTHQTMKPLPIAGRRYS